MKNAVRAHEDSPWGLDTQLLCRNAPICFQGIYAIFWMDMKYYSPTSFYYIFLTVDRIPKILGMHIVNINAFQNNFPSALIFGCYGNSPLATMQKCTFLRDFSYFMDKLLTHTINMSLIWGLSGSPITFLKYNAWQMLLGHMRTAHGA